MDQKNHEEQDKLDFKWGRIHLALFFTLIVTGIIVKRVFGLPELMMLFHGPAAVFLVVGGLKISNKQRRKFKEVIID